MKKLTFAVLTAALIAFLSGCSGPRNVEKTQSGEETESITGSAAAFTELDDDPATENKCGDQAYWKFENGTLTIYGKGDMYQFKGSLEKYSGDHFIPWETFRKEITSVVIQEGITSIGYNSFHACLFLKNVSLPDSLCRIGAEAFHGDQSLTDIIIPDSVKEIGDDAFLRSGVKSMVFGSGIEKWGKDICKECESLEKVTFREGLKEIGDSAFSGCTNLKTVVFSEGLERIGYDAFRECGISAIILPDSLERMGERAFYGNTGVKELKLGKGLTEIASQVFSDCDFDRLDLPEGIVSVAQNAFSFNKNLKDIRIPVSLTSIHTSAFRNCDNVKRIFYNGTKEQWNVNLHGMDLRYDISKYGGNITYHYDPEIWD